MSKNLFVIEFTLGGNRLEFYKARPQDVGAVGLGGEEWVFGHMMPLRKVFQTMQMFRSRKLFKLIIKEGNTIKPHKS